MAQAVTAGLDASGLRIPLHLFLHAFGRQRTMRALLIQNNTSPGTATGRTARHVRRAASASADTYTTRSLRPFPGQSAAIAAPSRGHCDGGGRLRSRANRSAVSVNTGHDPAFRDLGKQGADLVLRQLFGSGRPCRRRWLGLTGLVASV